MGQLWTREGWGLHPTGGVWEQEWKWCLGSCDSAGVKGAVETAVGDAAGGLVLRWGVSSGRWP